MPVNGTTTDQEIAKATTQLEGNGVSTTNISAYNNSTSYIDNGEMVSVSADGKEVKNINNNKAPTFFELLLFYILHPGEEFKREETKDDKLKNAQNAKKHNYAKIEPNGIVKINEGSEVQVISILEDHHFTTAILDNKNKTLVLIDPNGHILNTAKFRGCTTKKDVFTKLFGAKKAQELINKGYSLSDGNYYNPSKSPLPERETKIFDNVAESTQQKNGKQSEKGACGPVCHMIVKNYLKQRDNPENKDLQDILDATNIASNSTTASVAQAYNAIKNGNYSAIKAKDLTPAQVEELNEKRRNRTKNISISTDISSNNNIPRNSKKQTNQMYR